MKYPENTENTLYIDTMFPLSLEEIVERAVEHFEGLAIADMLIRSEEIQVDCFGYDLYDPCDWRDYIIIERRTT